MGKIKHSSDIELTPKQKIIFNEIKNSPFIRENFYFTGGTALSSVYLHHRLSEDLDFFSREKFDTLTILNLITDWSQKHNFKITSQETEVVRIFILEFSDKDKLKVDFGFYPYKRLKKGKIVGGIEVDSLFDIAVNKLQTIHQRSEMKDFVDLFFLLKEFTIWDLLEATKIKFRMELYPYTIAADCLKIERFENLPAMLVPLTLRELQDFYREKAKQLGATAVKK